MTLEEKKAYQREYSKKYYEANKEKIKAQHKKYQNDNAEYYKEYHKNYTRNPEYLKQYAKDNKAKIKEYHQEYKKLNKEQINQRNNEYRKNRKKIDPLFRLSENTRASISRQFKQSNLKKISKTEHILGCTFEYFKKHIESLWEAWMNWENYGHPQNGILEPNKTWDLDHIIPVSTATNELELAKLNHYSNFQPLCSHYNRTIKQNKII